MTKMRNRYGNLVTVVSVLVLVFVFFTSRSGFCDEKLTNEEKLTNIRNKILEISRALEQEQTSKNTLQAELRGLEKALNSAHREIYALDQHIKAKNTLLLKLQAQHKEYLFNYNQQKTLLGQQLRAAQRNGHQEQIKLLLSQNDPAALSRMFSYYSYFNNARLKLMTNIRKTLAEIENIEQQIRQETLSMENLVAEKKRASERLKADKENRSILLTRINKRIQENSSEIERLKTDARRVQDLLQSLNNLLSDIPDSPNFNRSFNTLKGRLAWPITGRIIHHFGEKRGSGDLLWQGIAITAKAGQDVLAVSRGRVAFADWLQGFGLIVIVDHRDGYMSLYAHNESLFKEAGDWVEQGERIAKAGNSGGLSESLVYLEIRFQGVPLDPKPWLKPSG